MRARSRAAVIGPVSAGSHHLAIWWGLHLLHLHLLLRLLLHLLVRALLLWVVRPRVGRCRRAVLLGIDAREQRLKLGVEVFDEAVPLFSVSVRVRQLLGGVVGLDAEFKAQVQRGRYQHVRGHWRL